MSAEKVEIALVSHECEGAIGDETNLNEMLRKAFKAARNHWMVLSQEPQFKGALNAVLKKLGDSTDKERLQTEIKLLAQMNAFIAAGTSGLSVSPPEVPERYEPVGILKLWHESK